MDELKQLRNQFKFFPERASQTQSLAVVFLVKERETPYKSFIETTR